MRDGWIFYKGCLLICLLFEIETSGLDGEIFIIMEFVVFESRDEISYMIRHLSSLWRAFISLWNIKLSSLLIGLE